MTDTVICEGCGRTADLNKPPEDIMAWRPIFGPAGPSALVDLADMGALCPSCKAQGELDTPAGSAAREVTFQNVLGIVQRWGEVSP